MSDLGDDFKALREYHQERKFDNFTVNMEVLFDSEFNFPRRFTVNEENRQVLFREKKKPKVNFYPSTDKWVVGVRVYRGDATKFLEWYRVQ
jgi:hypothetical protein